MSSTVFPAKLVRAAIASPTSSEFATWVPGGGLGGHSPGPGVGRVGQGAEPEVDAGGRVPQGRPEIREADRALEVEIDAHPAVERLRPEGEVESGGLPPP